MDITTRPATTTLTTVCAGNWTPASVHPETVLGVKDGRGVTGKSHTICPRCEAALNAALDSQEAA